MNTNTAAKWQLIGSMLIFSTIGLFSRWIPLPTGVVAMLRGAIGALFLLLTVFLQRKKPDLAAIRRRWPLLLASGAAIGFNWILLFESYRHTTIATATLYYYCAPIFVVLASPLIVREKLTLRRLLCVGVALIGMLGVSGVLDNGVPSADELAGILFGLGAALLYATVMLLNKYITGLTAEDKTISQLGTAAVVLLPYCLLTGSFSAWPPLSLSAVLALLTMGILHTGVAYRLYFGGMTGQKAQTIAIFSYIDPAVAILLSALVLSEPMTPFAAVGAVLILAAALISELPEKSKT